MENTLFVSNSINNLLPSLFNDCCFFSPGQQNDEISWHLFSNKIKKKKKISQMLLLQSTEINYQLTKILSRYFKLMLDDFSNFESSLFVLTFSLCCCYFIIFNPLSGVPLIYWTELLLVSIQLIVAWSIPYSV